MNIDEVIDYGYFEFNIKRIMDEKHVSVTKLAFRAELQRSQVYNFMNNKVKRLDLYVLARIVHALGCDWQDVIVYHPPGENSNKATEE